MSQSLSECLYHIQMSFKCLKILKLSVHLFTSIQSDLLPKQSFVIIFSLYSLTFRTLLVAIDFYSIFACYGSQWLPDTVWRSTFFKKTYFVFSRGEKKLIQVWNNLRLSKWWQNVIFWGWTIKGFLKFFFYFQCLRFLDPTVIKALSLLES